MISYEEVFGPPAVAAADLNELRVWAGARTKITPTVASTRGRELCASIDPTWPTRAVMNCRIMMSPAEHRDRIKGWGIKVQVPDSTLEMMRALFPGKEWGCKFESSKGKDLLWPAQSSSFQSWCLQVFDIRGTTDRPSLTTEIDEDELIHPAQLMLLVRGLRPKTFEWTSEDAAYASYVADLMVVDLPYWKFSALPFPKPLTGHWFRGLRDFPVSDMPADIVFWLRSAVCNGWFTSHSLQRIVGSHSIQGTSEMRWLDAGV